jgi:hypothetical protein
LQMPVPQEDVIDAGASAMRDGSDMISHTYRNRTITMRLRMSGSTQDDLINNWIAINSILLSALNAEENGYGAQVHLEYKWKSATNTVYFDVLHGSLEPSADFMSLALNEAHVASDPTVTVMIPEATLTLTCRPFAHAVLSVSHSNYIANPDHERGAVVPGDDWTEYNAGAVGSLAWDTVNRVYGSRSCQITHTGGVGSYYGVVSSNITVPTAASTAYLQLRTRYVSGAENLYVGVYDVTHAAWINSTLLMSTAADGTGWVVKGATFAKPIGCTSVWIRCYFAGDGDGSVACIDGWYLNADQTTAPEFWMSCKDLMNHEDGTAGHFNWFDLYDVEGDVPAGLRIAGVVGELAQRVRKTPYLFIQNYDSSYGALGAGMGTAVNAAFQNGSATQTPTAQQLVWTTVESWQTNLDMIHQYGRVRVFVHYAGNTNIELRVGIRYGVATSVLWFPNNGVGSGTLNTGGALTLARWDAGVFYTPPAALLPRDGAVDEWWWVVEYKKATGDGQAACIDCIRVTPIKEGYILGDMTYGPNVVDSTEEPPYTGRLNTIGNDNSSWSLDTLAPFCGPLYAVPTAQNRFFWYGGGPITNTAAVRLKILPRYLMVRGT